MRRKPGISLYRPPARKPTVMRRYGAFAGIGLLVGAVVGLGLTQMPVGQVAAVTSAGDKGCAGEPRKVEAAKDCAARRDRTILRPYDRKSDRSHRRASSTPARQENRTSLARP